MPNPHVSVNMANRFHLRTFFSSILLFASVHSLKFPRYNFSQVHPMYTLNQFTENRPEPVIMNKYYRFVKGRKTTSGMLFAPGAATYDEFPDRKLFASNLDALYPAGADKKKPERKEKFLEVHLNDHARVFLIMSTRNFSKELQDLRTFKGLGNAWSNLRAIRSQTRKPIPIGDPSRHKGRQLFLPSMGAVVERTIEKGKVLKLPHPRYVTVNGREMERFTLLIARYGVPGSVPVAHEYPATPEFVTELMTQKQIRAIPVVPNSKCPEWLHDLHVTPTRDTDVAAKQEEPKYWRTWHSMVDPIYWCYYDHEHGAFPGRYWPMFGYTAWKTFDVSTTHKRQDESHEGFKVYSFQLRKDKKFVVIVVHMHLSRARRFSARHHTVIFAVLNDMWEIEMELHMKMDFGAAQATLRNGKEIPINRHEGEIMKSLPKKKVNAGRRFNVLNVDEKYPESIGEAFIRFNNLSATVENKKNILNGVYEQWRAPLNTCSWTEKHFNSGFNFDVRFPSTAMKTLNGATEETMQILNGDNVNRFLQITDSAGEIEVGIEHCCFDTFRSDAGVSLEMSAGVFYTDPYFSAILGVPGKNSVRQYIRNGFATVKIKPGRITPVDEWSSHMAYEDFGNNHGRISRNIEGSVRKEVN